MILFFIITRDVSNKINGNIYSFTRKYMSTLIDKKF